MRGEAGEFTVHGPATKRADDAPGAPGKAIDGLPGSAWTAPVAGPCSWNLDLREVRQIGAVAILWQGEPPPRILLEGSEDGLVWHELSKPTQSDAAESRHPENVAFVLAFAARPIRHLRLSIPETSPGFVASIREFAVYGSLDELPSAWLVRGWVSGDPDAGLRTAGGAEALKQVRIRDGWRLVGLGEVPVGKRLVQIVPTASGAAFGLLESKEGPGESGEREIVRFSPKGNAGIELASYFEGLPHATSIAWDGEWVYVLSEGRLDAYRAALGDGPANERHRIGPVLLPTRAGFPPGFEISSLRLGDDGRFQARVGEVGGVVLDATGREFEIPSGETIRFCRNGRGLALAPRLPDPSESARIVDESEASSSTVIARIDGLHFSEADGPHIWAAFADGKGSKVALLEREGTGTPEASRLDWNQIPSGGLFPYLDHDRPSVRREAGLEILRRKRNPDKDIEAILGSGPSPKEAEGLLAFASGLSRERARPVLKRMAESAKPEVQRLAFRGLGNLPGGSDPRDFLALGVSTDPPVTAEILAALARTQRRLPGADEVAFALIDHPDPFLAVSASRYLIEKEEFGLAFSALDESGREAGWESAFALLAEAPPEKVLPEIVKRISASASSRFRRLGLEALCRIYSRIREGKGNEDLLDEIENRVERAVLDPRVDQAALFETIKQNGLPLPAGESLVALARENLALEAFVVSRLRESDEAVSDETRAWLRALARDKDRDERLREAVRSLLGEGPNSFESAPSSPPVPAAAVPRDEVTAALASLVGDPKSGRRLFRRLSCHSCHAGNFRGNSSAAGAMEHINVLLGERVALEDARGFILTETESGARFRGLEEKNEGGRSSFRDLAGNGFGLVEEGGRDRRTAADRLAGCKIAWFATVSEMADLLAFFRSGRVPRPSQIED